MKWILLILTVPSVWPTVTTLLDAHNRCRLLVERRQNGLLKRDCEHNRRREMLRLIKHLLLALGVLAVFLDPVMPFGIDRVNFRTALFLLVSWLLSATSFWDRRYTHELEDNLRREGHGNDSPVAPNEMQL